MVRSFAAALEYRTLPLHGPLHSHQSQGPWIVHLSLPTHAPCQQVEARSKHWPEDLSASILSIKVGSTCRLADDLVQHRDRRYVSISTTVMAISTADPSANLARLEAPTRSEPRLICISETPSKSTKAVVRDGPLHRRTHITQRKIE